MPAAKKKRWVVVGPKGFTLPDGSRAEPGDPIDKPDKWLIERGYVEEVSE